jgi:hypothetical protein
MKDRDDLIALVCAPHCRFYRRGEKEELSCGGYEFFRERLRARVAAEAARTEMKALAERGRPPERFEHDERIELRLCAACSFREEDCDFMSGEEVAGSVPCGGYVLLALLIASGCDEAEAWLNEPL